MGVYDPALCEKLANVLKILGTERAMVVHGMGMDVDHHTGETHVAELKDGTVTSYCLQPEDLGYPRSRPADIAGGSPEENARMTAAKEIPCQGHHSHEQRGSDLYLRTGGEPSGWSPDGGGGPGLGKSSSRPEADDRGWWRAGEAGAVPVTRIKICGIMNRTELFAAMKSGADAVGFVVEIAPPGTACPLRRPGG